MCSSTHPSIHVLSGAFFVVVETLLFSASPLSFLSSLNQELDCFLNTENGRMIHGNYEAVQVENIHIFAFL